MMKSRWDFRREYPPIIPGILGWRAPIIPLGFLGGTVRLFHWDFGMACPPIIPEVFGGHIPHNFVKISGGHNPKNYVGDGSIIDAMFPFRGTPKARQSFSPMVAASAATLGMGHGRKRNAESVVSMDDLDNLNTPCIRARASECAVLANASIFSRLVDNAHALDATPLGLAAVLCAIPGVAPPGATPG
jgi:hypothetical protein